MPAPAPMDEPAPEETIHLEGHDAFQAEITKLSKDTDESLLHLALWLDQQQRDEATHKPVDVTMDSSRDEEQPEDGDEDATNRSRNASSRI